jgi:hypothetical protein
MGAPSISGGMTADEQRKLLAEERQFQQEQEDKRRAMALEEEERRKREAEADRERLAAEEAARIESVNKAENAVIEEEKSLNENRPKPLMSKVSFYEALGKGMSAKAEKPL